MSSKWPTICKVFTVPQSYDNEPDKTIFVPKFPIIMTLTTIATV